MPDREQLADRRGQTTLATHFNGTGYAVSYGVHVDGRLAELFISTTKASSDAESIARDAAILISICLQHGAPFEIMRQAVTRDIHGLAAASIVGHALDLVAADMERAE